jgi:hypothetical protein
MKYLVPRNLLLLWDRARADDSALNWSLPQLVLCQAFAFLP